MKSILTVCLLIAFSVMAICQESDALKHAKQEKAAGTDIEMSMANQSDMMEKWLETIKLGDEHMMLAEDVGKYTYVSTFWMAPGSEPMTSKGTTVIEPIMEGRYFAENHEGSAMGMPFQGMSISGYDNVEKMYVSTWIDNMGTGIMKFTGQMNDDNQMVSNAKAVNPMTGDRETHKVVITQLDDGHQMDYYVLSAPGADEFHSMKIVYTRVD